jgi:hypothetical protein
MESVICDGCGGACVPTDCTTGYGETRDGRRLCFDCCNAGERAEFAAAETYCAYMSSDGRAITTWPGGELATVTYSARHRGGFGGEYFTVDATAPDGARWYGRGGGPGMFVRLRRRKSTRRA